MKNFVVYILLNMILIGISGCSTTSRENQSENLVDYIKPLVGTNGEGNTYPGAVAPFGMIQIGPDTDKHLWATASGYEYADSSIIGFSLTHLNGTGIPDLGDILFVPQVGLPKFIPGTKAHPDSGYRSRFTHDREEVSAGYYGVHMLDENVYVDMTASDRAGFIRFTFPETDSAYIITDLSHVLRWDVVWSRVRVLNDSTITGYHLVNGWAKERYIYFTAEYSRPFDDFGIIKDGERVIYNTHRFRSSKECTGENLQFFARYNTEKDEKILVKVAISAVSSNNAVMNLKAEIPHWDFNKIKNETKTKWNKELNLITLKGSEEEKETFYTAMYHSFLAPTIYEDVDGSYRGFDQEIHKSDGFVNHGIFSLWDTYRATHPLFNLIQAERNSDMINSMLAHYDQSVDNLLPVWSLNSNETWCMIGYHAVPVIADAYLKDVKGFDPQRAYNAIKSTAMNPDYDSVEDFARLGWVPYDIENEAVSKTLEYAFDDFTIAQMAKALGNNNDYEYFMGRADNYKNILDPESGFMRGRDSEGNWRTPFDPGYFIYWGDFTEGTSWQYTWYVPHDVEGLIETMGGMIPFTAKLDSVFALEDTLEQEGVDDIYGRIGHYWHGNEPSHHITYLYNWAGQPWKTQKLIHMILDNQYGNKPNSLTGNDDCGQMSAWYIFSTMGFYPVAPGSDFYMIGSPNIDEAIINLSNGNQFKVAANNLSDKNIYIQSATLNGKDYNKVYISYYDIKNGGEIIFQMGPSPNKEWGIAEDSLPK